MVASLREQAWRFVCATFPERQIYIRSDGRVQFFTFGPLMQAILAGISLLFLGWVAFTSVNVIFKDRIIATKERRFEQMQSSYEARIANLQITYDELNGALISAQDHFKSVADQFESKNQTLASLIERKQNLQASLGIGLPVAPAPAALAPPPAADPAVGGDDADVTVPDSAAALAPPSAAGLGLSQAAGRPAAVPHVLPPKPVAPGAPHAFLSGAVQKLGALFGRRPGLAHVDNPALHEIDAQAERVARLDTTQPQLLAAAEKEVDAEKDRLEKALRTTGIDAQKLIGRVNEDRAEGGPLIPLEPSDIGTNDPAFNNLAVKALASLDDLTEVVNTMQAVPLVQPVNGPEYGVTSGFGSRRDPFTKTLAFHAGVDFSGPWGSPVRVTAPGVVVFAGDRGGYGNAVEVDHGFGFRTRYGHLSAILVKVGTKLEKGAVVGKLGSTGRSTGPHVHYEVWYDDAVRDPSKFMKAGRYVLQE